MNAYSYNFFPNTICTPSPAFLPDVPRFFIQPPPAASTYMPIQLLANPGLARLSQSGTAPRFQGSL